MKKTSVLFGIVGAAAAAVAGVLLFKKRRHAAAAQGAPQDAEAHPPVEEMAEGNTGA